MSMTDISPQGQMLPGSGWDAGKGCMGFADSKALGLLEGIVPLLETEWLHTADDHTKVE